MKKSLMEIICCPTCKGNLNLIIEVEEKDEIIKGKLNCEKCKAVYTIKDSIPNLLPKEY